jgi:Metallo-peptidase family M12B Reprolysin-like
VEANGNKSGATVVDDTPLALFQGEVFVRGVRYPAAGSLIGQKLSITFPGRSRGTSSRQRVYTLALPVGSAQDEVRASVASSPTSVFAGRTCGDEAIGGAVGARPSKIEPLNVGLKAAKMYHVLTLSTEADAEMYARYGSSTNSVIAEIVNTAEVLFARQLGIRFQVVRQHAYTDLASSPLTTTDPDMLLRAFSADTNNPSMMGITSDSFDKDVDLKHLFTGKDLDGTTVGLAYIGTVCYLPQSAYGLTQVTSPRAAPFYFAHEVGHNLGALHDTMGGPASIMSPQISIGSSFSQLSIDQINEHLFYFGGCLDLVSQEDLLASANLSISQREGRRSLVIEGVLTSASNAPLSGETVRVYIGGRVRRGLTNQDGHYLVSVRTSEIKRGAMVYAASEGGQVFSRRIRVR